MGRQKKYKAVSLFSGAMGLDLGLESTGGFETVACVEKEHVFCETIRHNMERGRLARGDVVVIESDIKDIDPQEVLDLCGLEEGEVDLLVGGPPCQSYSTAGRRGTVQDPRGTLIWDFLRFVEALKPKLFLMENVRGLVSAAIKHRPIKDRPEKGGQPLAPEEEPGSVIRLFVEDLKNIADAPYRLDCFEVNAVNYGAPQLRERLLFIGNRFNEVVDFPEPTHGRPDEGAKQLALGGESMRPFSTLGDAIEGLCETDPVILDFSPRKKRYLAMVPPGGNWRCLPEEVKKESMGKAYYAKGGRSGWWRRLSFDLPCPTVVTMPNHASTSLCHPTEVRSLTLKECARIQEFPDEWEFCGTTQEQYMQVGNAVPIRLGEVAGRVILSKLSELDKSGWQKNENSNESYRLVYISSHIRTRRWYQSGEVHIWNDGESNGCSAYSPPRTRRKVREL